MFDRIKRELLLIWRGVVGGEDRGEGMALLIPILMEIIKIAAFRNDSIKLIILITVSLKSTNDNSK